jgi:hypothetical protein
MSDKVPSLLADNAARAARTEASERAILKAAEARLGVVAGEIDRLHGAALTDDGAADQYMNLILERGHLEQVIEHAKNHLRALPETDE